MCTAFLASATVLLAVLSSPAMSLEATTADERALLAADRAQRDAVASGKPAAVVAISHPDLRINAPSNRILTRDMLAAMVLSGEIRNDVFERTPESVTVTHNLGVVMGSETVQSPPTTEQARLYGTKELKRRYTNVYLLTRGKWLHIARHANLIPPQIAR